MYILRLEYRTKAGLVTTPLAGERQATSITKTHFARIVLRIFFWRTMNNYDALPLAIAPSLAY